MTNIIKDKVMVCLNLKADRFDETITKYEKRIRSPLIYTKNNMRAYQVSEINSILKTTIMEINHITIPRVRGDVRRGKINIRVIKNVVMIEIIIRV